MIILRLFHLGISCNVFVLTCTAVVLARFVMCGCFGNVYTCICCVLYCFCYVFVLFLLCFCIVFVMFLYCFVYVYLYLFVLSVLV